MSEREPLEGVEGLPGVAALLAERDRLWRRYARAKAALPIPTGNLYKRVAEDAYLDARAALLAHGAQVDG